MLAHQSQTACRAKRHAVRVGMVAQGFRLLSNEGRDVQATSLELASLRGVGSDCLGWSQQGDLAIPDWRDRAFKAPNRVERSPRVWRVLRRAQAVASWTHGQRVGLDSTIPLGQTKREEVAEQVVG